MGWFWNLFVGLSGFRLVQWVADSKVFFKSFPLQMEFKRLSLPNGLDSQLFPPGFFNMESLAKTFFKSAETRNFDLFFPICVSERLDNQFFRFPRNSGSFSIFSLALDQYPLRWASFLEKRKSFRPASPPPFPLDFICNGSQYGDLHFQPLR